MNPYRALADILPARLANIPALTAVTGFDGFVDEMIQVVGERQDVTSFTAMRGIGDFAAWAAAAAGRSSLREIVVHRQDPGGCAVNLGDGLAGLGVGVELFATLGAPAHAAFAPVTARFNAVTPLGAVHGRTLAFEFGDGKLMLSAVAQLATIDAALAEATLTSGAYPAACARAGLIALTNWTLYPHMTAVWRLLIDRVFSTLSQRPAFLLDLVDPSGRTGDDIRAMLALLPELSRHGHAALGVNLNEANVLARLLDVPPGSDGAALLPLAIALQRSIGVSEVVIHALRFAACAGTRGNALVPGPWTPTPVKLTGAGDRFNAGYGLGLMLDLPADQRLALGSATSGAFVRTGISPDLQAVLAGCRDFAE